jgi:thioredoxin reductase
VLHCPYCHGYEVADGRLGILVPSEASVRKALLLPDWSADVTLFTDATFFPDADQQAVLAARGIRVETRAVDMLVGDAPVLAGVRLRDGDLVTLDALFITPRTRMASPLAEQLGCEFDEAQFGPVVRTDARKETSVPGVFCAGDAARESHSATWAAADGATAGISAHQSLALGAVQAPAQAK